MWGNHWFTGAWRPCYSASNQRWSGAEHTGWTDTEEDWWVSSPFEASVIVTDWVLNHSQTNVSWYYFPQRDAEAITRCAFLPPRPSVTSNHHISNNLWLLSGHGVTDLPSHLSVCLSVCQCILSLCLLYLPWTTAAFTLLLRNIRRLAATKRGLL